jgi:hypothetical protein
MEVLNEEGRALEESDESEPEAETQSFTSTCTRKDDSGLEDEFEYPVDTHYPEEGWWSPEPPRPDSEEEVQCLVQVLGLKPQGVEPTLGEAVAGPREDVTAPDKPWKKGPPHPKGAKRKRLRKKVERTSDQKWEQVQRDAWLREMLSDTSGSEAKESCGRFAESGIWISELFKIPQHPATTSGGECSGQKTPDYP